MLLRESYEVMAFSQPLFPVGKSVVKIGPVGSSIASIGPVGKSVVVPS